MPAHVCLGPIKEKIPPDWTSLDLQHLSSRTNTSNKYVQLQVKNRHKHQKCWSVNRLKMLLTDGQNQVIDMFSVGKVADDLDICENGDTLLCLQYEVEECPGHYERGFQIILDDRGQHRSLVWVSKPAGRDPVTVSSPADAQSQERQKKKKDRKSGGPHTSYTYKVLSEVKVNTIVDVYGVVKFVKPIAKGKGSDYFCVIGLIDPSLVERQEDKLVCVFFNREPRNLPRVEEGDILRLHRLKIQTYQNSRQGYNGPGFQWVAFHGSLDTRTFSSASYTFEDQDKEMVTELLDWWPSQASREMDVSGAASVGKDKQIQNLSTVVPRQYFNMVGQVVQVCLLDPDECRLLRVCDGTKFYGPAKKVPREELNNSLRGDDSLMQAFGDLVYDVYVFDDHAHNTAHIEPGDFVQLTNVHAAVVEGDVELTVHGGGADFGRDVQVMDHASLYVRTVRARLELLLNTSANCLQHQRSLSGGMGQGLVAGDLPQEPSAACSSQDNSVQDQRDGLLNHRDNPSTSNYGESQVETQNQNAQQTDQEDSDNSTSDANFNSSEVSKVSPSTRSDNEPHRRERKDVPWKNKARARVLELNVDTVKDSNRPVGEVCPMGTTSSEAMVVESVREDPKSGSTQPFDMDHHTDKPQGKDEGSVSGEDSSQSIWLSLYDDPEITFKVAPVETTVVPAAGKRSGTGADLAESNKCEEEEEAENSSQSSFVTAESPDLHSLSSPGSTARALRPRVGVGQVTAKELPKSKETNSEHGKATRSAKQTKLTDNKSLDELCCSDVPENSKVGRGRAKNTIVTDQANCRRDPRADDEERSKSPTHEQGAAVNCESHDGGTLSSQGHVSETTFSQQHLQILDSNLLCFDTDEFSQKNTAGGGREASPVQESVLQRAGFSERTLDVEHSDVGGEGRRKRRRTRQVDSDEKEEEMEREKSQKLSSLRSEEQGQLSIDMNDGVQVEDPGDSQVSSSTDSLVSVSQPRCMRRTASVVSHPEVQQSSLRQVLDHPPPYKFRVQARVASIEPRPVVPGDLVHFLCHQCKFLRILGLGSYGVGTDGSRDVNLQILCPQCSQSARPGDNSNIPMLTPITILSLQLSDGQDSLVATVWDKNANQFFNGITPQHLVSSPSNFLQVQRWLSALCPQGSALEDRPLLECCIVSYCADGATKFQIFDTSLM